MFIYIHVYVDMHTYEICPFFVAWNYLLKYQNRELYHNFKVFEID